MNLLAETLKKRGSAVRTTFLKTGHIFAYLLVQFLVKLLVRNRNRAYPIRLLIDEKPQLFMRLFKLWLALDVLSISVRFFFSVLIPARRGRVVIVEEYFNASIADYIYLAHILHLPSNTVAEAVNFVTKVLQTNYPKCTVFLDAADDVLEQRWGERKSFQETPQYLQMQRTLLLSAGKLSGSFLHIDTGGRTVSETQQIITNHVLGRLRGKENVPVQTELDPLLNSKSKNPFALLAFCSTTRLQCGESTDI
jgi:hypothetical protein